MSDEPFLSASDLVTHNLIEWQEAVVIVQAVCDRLSPDGGVPKLDQIGILSTGDVVLLPAAASTEQLVRLLGYTLGALLQDSNPPAPLRLFVSQVTASSPLYSSLEEFSRGLAYFGRPDQSGILQAVYQRAMPVLAARAKAPTAQQSERRDAPSPEPRREVPRATTQQRRLIFGAIAIVAVCAASFAASRFDIGTRSSKLFGRTTASAAAVVHAGVSSGMDLLRKAGLASAPRTVPPPETAPQTSLPARRVSQRARVESVPAPESTGSVPAAASAPPPSDLSVSGPASAPTNSDLTRPVDSRIYTAEDTDVSLPILSSHQLPTLPSDASNPAAGVVVDLLINESGTVDSVKFVTPLVDMRQRMLISALKAWRYQPALKDGRAVRFLLRVRLAS